VSRVYGHSQVSDGLPVARLNTVTHTTSAQSANCSLSTTESASRSASLHTIQATNQKELTKTLFDTTS